MDNKMGHMPKSQFQSMSSSISKNLRTQSYIYLQGELSVQKQRKAR